MVKWSRSYKYAETTPYICTGILECILRMTNFSKNTVLTSRLKPLFQHSLQGYITTK